MPERTIAPAIHEAVTFDFTLPDINREQLENGLELFWLQAGVQDVAEVDFVFPAGVWHEQKPGTATAVAALLKNGTSRRSAHEIHESIEFYGASLNVQVGNDYVTVSLYTLTKYLKEVLPVVYELLTDAVFPEEELDIYRRNAVQRLLVNLRKCDFVANQQIDAGLFGPEHPYGRYSKQENIEAIRREDLIRFYTRCYGMGGVRLFMAGNVGEAEVRAIHEVFGGVLPEGVSGQSELPEAVVTPAAERAAFTLNDPEGVQGAIRIGRRIPDRKHPDFAPLTVLNTIFGGYFGSRLMRNIREEKGYTYGIYSGVRSYLHDGGTLTIQAEVGRDVVDDTLAEIYKEMQQICTEEIPGQELQLVKNYVLGNLLGDLDGPFSIMQRWRSLILNGLGEADFHRNIARYKSVTAAELLQIARKYLQREDFYEVVVV